jgi:hypothetical protein
VIQNLFDHATDKAMLLFTELVPCLRQYIFLTGRRAGFLLRSGR